MIQWIRLCTSTAGVRVQSLFRELRSHMLCNVPPPPKKGGEQPLLITESVQCTLLSHAFTHAPLEVSRFFQKSDLRSNPWRCCVTMISSASPNNSMSSSQHIV